MPRYDKTHPCLERVEVIFIYFNKIEHLIRVQTDVGCCSPQIDRQESATPPAS